MLPLSPNAYGNIRAFIVFFFVNLGVWLQNQYDVKPKMVEETREVEKKVEAVAEKKTEPAPVPDVEVLVDEKINDAFEELNAKLESIASQLVPAESSNGQRAHPPVPMLPSPGGMVPAPQPLPESNQGPQPTPPPTNYRGGNPSANQGWTPPY